ncbi:SsgA family sporulation/cell division regulator [Streptomyces sp. NPDC001941]|uniref:SsgA family sporulation/cell division regulator n=1 Tax=Streptomyces sp. NPDC001941 TaxID=3154659 RepID=UPI00332AD31D
MPAGIIHIVPARVHVRGADRPLEPRLLLVYSAHDPLAVQVVFPQVHGEEPIRWTFARDLLAEGLRQPAGVGDVRVAPCGDGWLRLALSSPEGYAELQLSAEAVGEFVRHTGVVVPPGLERTDDSLEALLGTVLTKGQT